MSNDTKKPSWIVLGVVAGVAGAAITGVITYFDKHKADNVQSKTNEVSVEEKPVATEQSIAQVKNIVGKTENTAAIPSEHVADSYAVSSQQLARNAAVG